MFFFFMELHTHLEHWPKNWEGGEIDGVFFSKKKNPRLNTVMA